MKDSGQLDKSHHPFRNMRGHAHRNALFCLSETTVSVLIFKKGKEQVQLKLSNALVDSIPIILVQ